MYTQARDPNSTQRAQPRRSTQRQEEVYTTPEEVYTAGRVAYTEPGCGSIHKTGQAWKRPTLGSRAPTAVTDVHGHSPTLALKILLVTPQHICKRHSMSYRRVILASNREKFFAPIPPLVAPHPPDGRALCILGLRRFLCIHKLPVMYTQSSYYVYIVHIMYTYTSTL